jgi:hypothetical protein
MMTGTKRILAVLGISLLSLQLAKAQVPIGDSVVNVADSPVYYLGGEWSFTNVFTGEAGQPLTVDFAFPLVHGTRGRITGDGMTWLYVGGYAVAAEYRVKGSVSGGGDKPTMLTLSVSFRGQGDLAGADTRFNVKLNYALTIDGANVGGTVRGKGKFGNLGSASLRKTDFVTTRPDNDSDNTAPDNFPTGDWAAQISVLPLKKLAGSGKFIVGPAILPASLSGKFSETKNTGYFTLKGRDQGKGSTVKFYYTGSNPTDMKGILLGQRVR